MTTTPDETGAEQVEDVDLPDTHDDTDGDDGENTVAAESSEGQ